MSLISRADVLEIHFTKTDCSGGNTGRQHLSLPWAESCPEAEAAQPGSPVLMGGPELVSAPDHPGLEREPSPVLSLFISYKLAASTLPCLFSLGPNVCHSSPLQMDSCPGFHLTWVELVGETFSGTDCGPSPSPSLLQTTWLLWEQNPKEEGLCSRSPSLRQALHLLQEEMTNAGQWTKPCNKGPLSRMKTLPLLNAPSFYTHLSLRCHPHQLSPLPRLQKSQVYYTPCA